MAHAVRKFRVKYSSVESFCREYEKNLRFGGLFIATAQPATIHSVLELVLVLPEFDEDFSLRGEVVLVQDEATAWALEQKPGMAVQVIRDDQIRLDELKEKLARMRTSSPADPKGPFLYSSPINMPKIENTDFLFGVR